MTARRGLSGIAGRYPCYDRVLARDARMIVRGGTGAAAEAVQRGADTSAERNQRETGVTVHDEVAGQEGRPGPETPDREDVTTFRVLTPS